MISSGKPVQMDWQYKHVPKLVSVILIYFHFDITLAKLTLNPVGSEVPQDEGPLSNQLKFTSMYMNISNVIKSYTQNAY